MKMNWKEERYKEILEFFRELDGLDINDHKLPISLLWDKTFEAMQWKEEIPYLKFKEEFEVKVLPPFRGAIIRFNIKNKENSISVYLDGYNILGMAHLKNVPYWEIYPNIQGETERFLMNDTYGLMKAIEESLDG